MDQINSEILRQFEKQGMTINEGIAVDARLVKSASRPISNDQIKELKDRRNTPKGKLDKNGKFLKFSRDLESDWTVENGKQKVKVQKQFLHTQKIPGSLGRVGTEPRIGFILQRCVKYNGKDQDKSD